MDVSGIVSFWKEVFLHPKEFFEKADLDEDLSTTLKKVLFFSFAFTFGIEALILGLVGLILVVLFFSMNPHVPVNLLPDHLTEIAYFLVYACVTSLLISMAILLTLIINAVAIFLISKFFVKEVDFSRLTHALAICLPFIFLLFFDLMLLDYLGLRVLAYSWGNNPITFSEWTIGLFLFVASIALVAYALFVIMQAIKSANMIESNKASMIVTVWFPQIWLTSLIIFLILFFVIGLMTGPGLGNFGGTMY